MKKLKVWLFLLCSVIVMALMPTVAQAEGVAYIESDITVDTTWHAGTYYICHVGNREPIVKEGVTLTIESGSTVYFGNRVNVPVPDTGKYPYSSLTVNGTLIANGVTFTTIPDSEGETLWKDAGWQGIIANSVDPAKPASLSFTNCTFRNCRGAYTVSGVERNGGDDAQEVNITVNNCVFESPNKTDLYPFSAAIYYSNGQNRAGKGTISVKNTEFTDYNRGIIVGGNQRDDIDISIDGCTFNNVAKELIRIESGRSAILQNCTFNDIKGGMERIVEIFYAQNERSSAEQTVTISGNKFNGDETTVKYPIVVGANAKINENADGVPNTFSRTYPKAYRYIRFSGGIGSISTTYASAEHAVWGYAGTPYLMTNDVRVYDYDNEAQNDGIHSSLVIKPGVTVNFAAHVGLDIDGALTAEGRADKHITFRKKPGADWCFGLTAGGALEGPISLKYCDFIGLNHGIIKVKSTASTPLIEIENCTVQSASDAQDNLFTDVSEKDWFYDAVSFAYENGLMTGTGNKTFSPAANTSRSMIVTILWRLEGEPDAADPGSFADVADGKWYSKAVAWAAENGIVDGYSADKFGPEDIITHEQMVKILYSYGDYKKYNVSARGDLSFFTDSPSSWALEHMKWAAAKGLLQGKDNVLLSSRGNTTRSECAVILQRFIEKYDP